MADGEAPETAAQRRKREKAEAEAQVAKERPLTDYAIFKLMEVQPVEDYTQVFANAEHPDFERLQHGTWVLVDRKSGASQELAIEAHTGKGEGARIGTFRAVAWSSWKGSVTVEPPQPVLEDRRKVDADG